MTANQHPARVGFIGLGDQGAPMAQAISDSGFGLDVWARRPQSLDVLARTRHTVHDSPASLAAAVDILELCLRDDRDIWEVLGTPGVEDALRPGLIIVNHGTGDPGENREIAEHLAGKKVAYLDAPVSGGGAGARARTLTTMAGGDRTAYQKCEPVFAAFSRTVAYMGPSGSGQVTKLLNNAMTMSNLDNAVDLIRLVSRLGMDVQAVIDVIDVSSGGSAILRALGSDVAPEITPHTQVTNMKHTQPEPVLRPGDGAQAPQGLELRHLRYFVAVADAGSFTHAAQRIFIAQPTLSQQIRRLEQIVGTPLLHRRREGLRLTTAGGVLLDASRNVLSLVDHEVSRTRQAAGLGRPRLRMVIPPGLPEDLAVKATDALRAAAAAADVNLTWLETALDTEFSLIHTRRADAGLGWLTTSPDAVPAPLEVMILGEFEPDLWIPSIHTAAHRDTISLEELARLDVIHGPRRAHAGTYDAWTTAIQTVGPRFEFTDPPFHRSLPLTLAFAATADRPAAVLTGPATAAGGRATPIRRFRLADTCGMVKVSLRDHPLTASAVLAWSGDLPRPLQQLLFQTADNLTTPPPPQPAELASPTAA